MVELISTLMEKMDSLQQLLHVLHGTLQQQVMVTRTRAHSPLSQADKVETEKIKALRARNALATVGQVRTLRDIFLL